MFVFGRVCLCVHSGIWTIRLFDKITMTAVQMIRLYFIKTHAKHYGDVIMSTVASWITSLTIVYSTAYWGADQRNIKATRHWPLCEEFTGTGEFPAQRASNAENVSIWWRHHETRQKTLILRHHDMKANYFQRHMSVMACISNLI